MAVAFEELTGSPTQNVANGKVTAKREFLCNWADYPEFINDLLGVRVGRAGRNTSREGATFPGQPRLYATQVSVEPFGDTTTASSFSSLKSTGNQYEKAKVTVTYSTADKVGGEGSSGGGGGGSSNPGGEKLPDIPEGTFLSFESNGSVEYLTVPGRIWKWQNASKEAGQDVKLTDDVVPGIIVPTETVMLRWNRVTSPPIDKIREYRGSVNGSTFLGHDRGTVLFVSDTRTREFQFGDEQPLWQVVYAFQIQSKAPTKVDVENGVSESYRYGWNHLLNPETKRYDKPIFGENKVKQTLYNYVDFDNLFQFGLAAGALDITPDDTIRELS